MSSSMKAREEARLCREQAREQAKILTQALPQDPQERAISILEDDAEFSDHELNEVIDFFMADRNLARAYATLKTPRMRSSFLKHQLVKLRKE